MPGAVQDLIKHANFSEYRLRGFGVARGRILAFPLIASSPLKHSSTTVCVMHNNATLLVHSNEISRNNESSQTTITAF